MVKQKNCFILGKTYDVLYRSDTEMAGNMGTANRGKQVIMVKSDMGEDQILETILHEVIHCVDEELLIGLTEEQVSRLAVGLYSCGISVPVSK